MRKSRILNRQSKRVVQLALDPAARAVAFQQEVRALTERAVLELALDILDNEVNHLYGRLYRHNTAREYYRHGSQMGGVTVCGQRLRLERPRVRKKGGGEAELEHYRLLNHPSAMGEAAMRRVVHGVSTRNYSKVIEAFTDGYGITRSNISRAFIRSAEQSLEKLCSRRFDQQRFAAVFIDGIEYAGTTLVVALGLREDGKKRVLGLREGATENAAVVTELLADIRQRAVDTQTAMLFVIDGSKALRKAVNDVWGELAVVQRCQVHKKRNVRNHLPEKYWDDLDKRLSLAWGVDVKSYSDALKSL